MQRQRYRTRSVGLRERPVPFWAWALVAGGLISAIPTWGQGGPGQPGAGGQTGAEQAQAPSTPVPEMVRPRSNTPTLPEGNDGSSMPAPRSENPQVGGSGRPVPDRGVIAPPVSGVTPVIPPPVAGTMPVIPPPGSAGGDRSVVPK